jgi:AraC family transcriptional regulator of adaptative response / DNA-3-methyladenine glycosylase II
MIIDGALDAHTEEDLANMLAVSARHLRRLFAEHVGATPDQLARSCRAHFARRLLDDTDLSVTEIAFAAGFGSVRQLHRASQQTFRATPRELRARRRHADRLIADGGLLLRLAFTGPLDWHAMLAYLQTRAIPGVESVANDTYRRTVTIDDHPGILELAQGGPDHLLLTAHLPHWEGLIHIVQRARRIFALDLPLEEATAHLSGDPIIGGLISARPGLRSPGAWDPFETGVRAIIGQQITIAGANTIAGRLVEQLGTPLPGVHRLGLSHTFPSPHLLASADLSKLGLPRARAAAIQAFAQSVERGDVRLDRRMTLQQLTTAVTAIPGLGPWTAHYIALRLGERDAFPADDLGLRRAVNRLNPDPTQSIAQLGVKWSPWRATAAIHLWHACAPSPSENPDVGRRSQPTERSRLDRAA